MLKNLMNPKTVYFHSIAALQSHSSQNTIREAFLSVHDNFKIFRNPMYKPPLFPNFPLLLILLSISIHRSFL